MEGLISKFAGLWFQECGETWGAGFVRREPYVSRVGWGKNSGVPLAPSFESGPVQR